MGSNNTLEVSVVIGAESPCVINALNMEYDYDLNSLGCVLEGLTNKKERDKIGKEGEK
ncbi:MAG: hypothetical protein IJC57_02510 [Clostridia bacterium]|nr:hypothetical protein [Clostridia bacterium]